MTPMFADFGHGEWDPRSIPGWVCDFDARFGVSTVGGGDATVTNWQANLGVNYFFGPSGTAPQLEAAGWAAPTSGRVYPSIALDGVDDELICINTVGGLSLPQRLIGGNDQPGTFILVFELLSFAATQQLLTFSKAGGPQQRLGVAAISGTNVWRVGKTDDTTPAGGSQVLLSSSGAPNTNKHVLVVAHSGAATKAYLDGVEIISGSQDVGDMTVDRVELGANNGTVYANARYTRATFYSGQLTPEQAIYASGELGAMYL